jgi:hypothetical protein
VIQLTPMDLVENCIDVTPVRFVKLLFAHAVKARRMEVIKSLMRRFPNKCRGQMVIYDLLIGPLSQPELQLTWMETFFKIITATLSGKKKQLVRGQWISQFADCAGRTGLIDVWNGLLLLSSKFERQHFTALLAVLKTGKNLFARQLLQQYSLNVEEAPFEPLLNAASEQNNEEVLQ